MPRSVVEFRRLRLVVYSSSKCDWIRCLKGIQKVSSSIPGTGTLTFMVGADTPEDLKAATEILSAMGNPKHCGGTGLGQAVKVSNNLILAASMLGVAEGFRLAK